MYRWLYQWGLFTVWVSSLLQYLHHANHLSCGRNTPSCLGLFSWQHCRHKPTIAHVQQCVYLCIVETWWGRGGWECCQWLRKGTLKNQKRGESIDDLLFYRMHSFIVCTSVQDFDRTCKTLQNSQSKPGVWWHDAYKNHAFLFSNKSLFLYTIISGSS